ncbi:MAG: Asp-tRNA(Asn)/Glu-tRNA(Gln) amidotransferase subunit GatA [Acidobacteriota bacterium]
MDVHRLSVRELRAAFEERQLSAEEICQALLTRIERLEPHLHAFIRVTAEEALEQARDIDRRRAAGEQLGALAAVPIAVKDNICTRGVLTTCGSKILQNHRPIYDATVCRRLRQAGAVLIGKTNMDEFAMGSSTENSAFGPTRNPWSLECVPGGSSGGSAAAVAAEMVPAALGSDTGGSIRQPGALCGVPALKPTYGRVSRYGLVAFASSLDQIGPFGKTVEDLALVLDVIAGHDACDSTSSDVPAEHALDGLEGGVEGIRIGVPREYFSSELDPEVGRSVEEAVKLLESLGARARSVSMPNTRFSVPTYYLVATAEASSNLARYDGVRYGVRAQDHRDLRSMYHKTRSQGFGSEVKRRIMLGTYSLSSGYYDAYYLQAMKSRSLIRRDFEEAFREVDVLATPTTPCPAFRLGEKLKRPLEMYLLDIYTATINLAGVPAVSLPCGWSKQGLPLGVQLIGSHFQEPVLLRVARTYEKARRFREERHALPLENKA